MQVENIETSCNIGTDKPSKTIVKRVGCGNLYITIREHYNGHFDRLIIKGSMTRHNDCGASNNEALAKICTFAIRRALEEDSKNHQKRFTDTVLWKGIIKQIIDIGCNKYSRATEKSCSSAIGYVIKDYVKTKLQEEK
jgi:hypothetical protein